MHAWAPNRPSGRTKKQVCTYSRCMHRWYGAFGAPQPPLRHPTTAYQTAPQGCHSLPDPTAQITPLRTSSLQRKA